MVGICLQLTFLNGCELISVVGTAGDTEAVGADYGEEKLHRKI